MRKICLVAGLAAVLFLGGCNFQGSVDLEEEQASDEVTVQKTVYQYKEPEPVEPAIVEVVQPLPEAEYDPPPTNNSVSVERNTTVVVPPRPTPQPQPKMARGNQISCPSGSVQNAAGTRCTDKATGMEVGPNWKVTPNAETAQTNPCPEMMKKDASGRCVAIPMPNPKAKSQ